MNNTSIKEITDLKEKLAFVKAKQKAAKNNSANNPFVLTEYKDKKVFLDTTRLSGNKYFFHIPYSKYLINNDWKHQAFCMGDKLETILNHIKVFDAEFKAYTEDEAKAYLKETFGLE